MVLHMAVCAVLMVPEDTIFYHAREKQQLEIIFMCRLMSSRLAVTETANLEQHRFTLITRPHITEGKYLLTAFSHYGTAAPLSISISFALVICKCTHFCCVSGLDEEEAESNCSADRAKKEKEEKLSKVQREEPALKSYPPIFSSEHINITTFNGYYQNCYLYGKLEGVYSTVRFSISVFGVCWTYPP